jgi:hypothetical protein
MSKFPVDIVNLNEDYEFELETAINIANAIQDEFIFTKTDRKFTQKFKLIHLEENDGNEFLENALEIRNDIAGYYPYLLFVSSNPLRADGWTNLFAHNEPENGMSIITTNMVASTIIPENKMESYFIYYFARTLMKFILINKYNHENPSDKGCVFDFMQQKKDILKSMRANAICDVCKKETRKHEKKLSENQYCAIDTLLAKSGQLLSEERKETAEKESNIRIFIGSSK